MFGDGPSFHFPCVAREHHVAQRGMAFACAHVSYLCFEGVGVGGGFDIAYHTHGERQVGAVHHGELLVQEVGGCVCVVHQHVVKRVTVLTDGYGFEQESVLHEAAFVFRAECHFLSVAQVYRAFGAVLAVGHAAVDAVVEDYAVLQNLYDRCAFVARGGHEHFLRSGEFHTNPRGLVGEYWPLVRP